MSQGDIKTLGRPDDTLPEVTYDKMTTLLQEGKVPTSVLIAPTARSWAGRPMVDVTAAHLTENNYDDPLSAIVEFWYPREGGKKKNEEDWNKHMAMVLLLGWRAPQRAGSVAFVDEVRFPRETSYGKSQLLTRALN